MKLIWTTLLATYVILLLALAMAPSSIAGHTLSSYDKPIHLIQFFILAVLMLKTISYYDFRFKYIFVIVLVAALVIGTEVVQIYIPSRTFSYKDMAFDLIGVGLAAASRWIFSKD